MQFLLEANEDGYVFSDNGGKTPVGIEKINRQYDRALEKMRMTEHYTHFDTRQFTEVRDVQTNLLTFNKSKKNLPTKVKTEKTDNAVKAKATKTAKKTVMPTAAAIKKNPAKKPQAGRLAAKKMARA